MGGVIGGVLGLAGGLLGANASDNAADAQLEASHEANELQKYMFDTLLSVNAPYRNIGANSLNYLAQLMGVSGKGGTPNYHPGQEKPEKPMLSDFRREVPTDNTSTWPPDNPWGGGSAGISPQGAQSDADGGSSKNDLYYMDEYRQAMKDWRSEMKDWNPPKEYGSNTGLEKAGNMIEKLLGITGGPNAMQKTLEKLPGYQWARDEGLNAVDRSAAARGGVLSGAAIKGAERFGTGLADQYYQQFLGNLTGYRSDELNRLANMAGLGQTANSITTQAGMNYGNNAADAIIYGGNARAQGMMNQANYLTGGLNSLANNYLMNSWKGGTPSNMMNTYSGGTQDFYNAGFNPYTYSPMSY